MSDIARRRDHAKQEPGAAYVARRRALINAAAEAFRAKGYQGVRMDDIATEGGTNRATLYYYFSNKQELFRAVIIDAVERNVTVAQTIAAGTGSAREKLRALLVALVDSYQTHYPYMFVYVQEDMSRVFTQDTPQTARLRTLGRAYEDTVEQVIADGLAAGEFRLLTTPRLAAYALIGAANWTHRWYDPSGGLSGADVGGMFADLFLDGLADNSAAFAARG